MARYVLECPQCEAHQPLDSHVPGKRVHCRKCGAAVIIPGEDGTLPEAPPAKPLDPKLRKKLVSILSLRKLAVLSLLLAAAVAGGAFILLEKSRSAGEERAPKVEEEVTPERMAQLNRVLALPLGEGFAWEYAIEGGGTEVRKVLLASRGGDDAPHFDVGITDSREAARQVIRVQKDGLTLLSETRRGKRSVFSPPLRLVPHPLYTDDAWRYEGECIEDGGGSERWTLAFAGQRPEQVDTGIGKLTCFRVHVEGMRGGRKVEEVVWYAKGIGIAKRRTSIDGVVETATLMKFTTR